MTEKSEYRFYSFRGSHEHSTKPTFQEWLDRRHGPGRFQVHEYPTEDGGPRSLSDEDVASIGAIIQPLIEAGETIVMFDSFGSERTGPVWPCARLPSIATPISTVADARRGIVYIVTIVPVLVMFRNGAHRSRKLGKSRSAGLEPAAKSICVCSGDLALSLVGPALALFRRRCARCGKT